MMCLFCDNDTTVVNSRLQKRENNVWRRRKCKLCKTVFTTIEEADLAYSIRVASDNPTEPIQEFSKSKLLISIYQSCRHLKQPENVAEALSRTVLSELLKQKSALIYKNDIKIITLKTLNNFDQAAGVQYQAFHKIKR